MYSVESAQRIAETHDIKLPTSKGHVSLSPHYRKQSGFKEENRIGKRNKWKTDAMGLVQLLSALYFLPLLSYFTFFCGFASLQLPHCYTRQAQCSITLSSTVLRSVLNRHISPFHLKFFASPTSKQRLPSLTMES